MKNCTFVDSHCSLFQLNNRSGADALRRCDQLEGDHSGDLTDQFIQAKQEPVDEQTLQNLKEKCKESSLLKEEEMTIKEEEIFEEEDILYVKEKVEKVREEECEDPLHLKDDDVVKEEEEMFQEEILGVKEEPTGV